MRWILKCLWKYGNFSGRAGIVECFVFVFFVFSVVSLALGLDLVMGWERENVVDWMPWYPSFEISRMLLVLPTFAVSVRRLHDTGRSGWAAGLWCVPLVGWAYLLFLLAQDADEGANAYGLPSEE